MAKKTRHWYESAWQQKQVLDLMRNDACQQNLPRSILSLEKLDINFKPNPTIVHRGMQVHLGLFNNALL